MTRDWRDGHRELSARISVLERRSETSAIKALKRMLMAANAEQPCTCKPALPCCELCEAWEALGHAGPWPGAVKAARRLER